MRYTIWDIDNCLADDHWRQCYVNWGEHGDARYDAYNSRLSRDLCKNLEAFQLFTRLQAVPLFFTGRPEKWRADTAAWLQVHLEVDVKNRLFMRPDNTVDLGPVPLKQQMLRSLYRKVWPGDIIAAFDDIPAVVNMYRGHGIPAAVLAIHSDLSGVYEPADLI